MSDCQKCGHAEDDHDGYGGLCDGGTDPDTRSMCGCTEYVAPKGKPKLGGYTCKGCGEYIEEGWFHGCD